MVYLRCLLCSLLFCSIAPEFVTSTSKLPGIENYQVVKPLKLHAKHKRESEGLYPTVVQYGVTVGGKELVVHLEKNEHLIAKNYSETYYLENGTEVTSTPLYQDHCYYHGYIKGEGGSSASFSTCDGLSGYFRTNGQRYLMEPLKESDSDEHALFKYEELRLPLQTCGVVNTSRDNLEPRVEETFGSPDERSDFLKAKKYIELFVVADYSEFQKFRTIEAVRSRVFEVVNHVNVLYKPLKTHVALLGLEIWSNGDKISVSRKSGQTLSDILKWRNTNLLPRKKHDNIQFITYVDFEGDTIGLAQVSAMCTGGSGAINQDHHPNVHGVASTMAHEMGHNLGMDHDDSQCICSSRSCIMSPVLSSTYPTEFSSCSHQNFQSFTLTHTASCLRNVPSRDDIVSRPICGNGFVENGEECDCGSPAECQNPCCDAQTCKLQEGVQCADGKCCQDCKLKTAGSLCRRKKNDCDLPENCDGKSNVCPKDAFGLNGTPCKKATSFCYNGECPTLQEQCVSLWGAGAQPGQNVCFRRNTKGDVYSHCKKTSSHYQPCNHQDIMCGQLSCTGGNAQPTFATRYGTIIIGQAECRVILDEKNRGKVQNGIKCEANKMCLNAKCIDVKGDNCSASCSGHAVCNHLQQCQCEEGWAPPNCDNRLAGTFSSTVIIIIVVIAVFLIVAVGLGVFLYRKCTAKSTTQPRTQPIQTSGLSNPAFADSAPETQQVTKAYNPKGPMKIPPPPPPYSQAAPSPYLHVIPSAPRAPPQIPAPGFTQPSAPMPSALKARPPMPAPRPTQPSAPTVLMPPTKRRY
ncbi:zinc metalloproteinase-disintegrin-like ohanin [Heptranchias perlo]|uniref:zinc metalloproteinase-disintegrin-like ohanin n=1 Tax=Heptranchias perlo TaxID=212740 RepID=UPI00355A0568